MLLLKQAAGLEASSTEGQSLARRMLALLYDWTDLNVPGLDRSHEIPLLEGQLKAKEDTITSLKPEHEKEIRTLKELIAGKDKVSNELREQLRKSQNTFPNAAEKRTNSSPMSRRMLVVLNTTRGFYLNT